MASSSLPMPLAAAGLVATGAMLAWIVSPDRGGEVLAAPPGGQGTSISDAAGDGLARLSPGTGVLEVTIHGLVIPYGQETHARVDAVLRMLAQPGAALQGPWSDRAPVVESRVAFGDVPRDRQFELVLVDETGEMLLRTTLLGPGEGNKLDPEHAHAAVRLGRRPR